MIANMLFYLLYCFFDMSEVLLKLLSVSSFYLIHAVILLISKAVWIKKRGTFIYILLTLSVLIGVSATYIYMIQEHYIFTIGASTGSGQRLAQQVYMLIVPFTVLETDMSHGASFYPMIANLSFGLVSMLSLIFIKKLKINW
jgi:hypothetical protein